MNAPLAIPNGLVYRLSRSIWDRMVESGVLDDARVELIDGVMVEMCPENAAHAATIRKIGRLLGRLLPAGHVLSEQHPLRLADTTEPEPDLAIVPDDDYDHTHPTTALLVIEVADSSLRQDRTLKRAVYARARIPEYWIVNLRDRVVEICTAPDGEDYRVQRVVREDEALTSLTLPGLSQPLAALLPRPAASTQAP